MDRTYRADAAHSVVNTPGTETALNNLEPAAWAKDHAALRHADIIEAEVTVTVRSIVIAEH